ncbi:MAG TPA: glycosyltransferase family 2 protein [Abditibacteriaceae bacterium]|jgi:glycosyltransferase involved in cell wall biosynthesis
MKISLALLAYNESAVIERVVREAAAEMAKNFAPDDWELLIVNDGSRDDTGQICDRLAEEVAGVRVYHHNPNRGYVEATLSSLRESRGDYVCIFDGDGQQTAADVPRFVEKLDNGYDVIFGWKKQRFDETPRLILSRGLRLAARYFLHSRLHDINAGCRGFRRAHAEPLSIIKHRINFIGPEIYTRARLNNLKIGEIVVRHAPREGGESSHALNKIPAEIAQVINYLRALRGELQAANKWRRYLP